MQSGQLSAQKIGGKWLIRTDDLKAYLTGKFRQNCAKEV
ncbi:MAG: helix-turn-helix domain-containing protein [Clostridium sp.]|nr:helix-turn-helix domain-containing protein [Clostridium sp.]